MSAVAALAAASSACPGAFAASAASLQVVAGANRVCLLARPARLRVTTGAKECMECMEHSVIRPKLVSTEPAEAHLHSDRLFQGLGVWADICRPLRDLEPEEQPVLTALKFHISQSTGFLNRPRTVPEFPGTLEKRLEADLNYLFKRHFLPGVRYSSLNHYYPRLGLAPGSLTAGQPSHIPEPCCTLLLSQAVLLEAHPCGSSWQCVHSPKIMAGSKELGHAAQWAFEHGPCAQMLQRFWGRANMTSEQGKCDERMRMGRRTHLRLLRCRRPRSR